MMSHFDALYRSDKLTAEEAKAAGHGIAALDGVLISIEEAGRLWALLKERCPHPSFSNDFSDDPHDPECDACYLPQSKA